MTKAGFVELGALKGNEGDQNYDIPASVDLEKYRAVTIWCHRFNVNSPRRRSRRRPEQEIAMTLARAIGLGLVSLGLTQGLSAQDVRRHEVHDQGGKHLEG